MRRTLLCAAVVLSLSVPAAEVSGRKMVWAHYVPWFSPDIASQLSDWYYSFPQFEVGKNPLRDEVRRALDMGIDGFFNDMVVQKKGYAAYWDLRPYLKAAEGTPFQFGICLDAKTSVETQVKELVRMLSTYGDHPNYPKWNGKYVVSTFTYLAWTPDEWRAIRKGCADAGYPIWLIANVETGYESYSDRRLEPYSGLFEGAYFFAITGCAWSNTKPLERENREAAAFCARKGAMFIPCLWPGYYGSWLYMNCLYHPLLGFDSLLRRYDCARTINAPWLHITTWNDHGETTLQSRRLATGNTALVRAMAREFKGQYPAAKEEIEFAYLRETMVGTVLRIEGLRLPSSSSELVTVEGRLLDADGKVVARLDPRQLSADWERCEWIVPTTALAASPLLVPVVRIVRKGTGETLVRSLPPAFLVTAFLRCNDTVKVSERDRRQVKSSFDVGWKDGLLTGSCDFTGEEVVRRAILYRNDRPLTAFDRERKTVLPVRFSGQNTVGIGVENGKVDCAVKSYETNGAPHFTWNEKRIRSILTPSWMRLTARLEADASTVITLTDDDKSCSFRAPELVEKRSFAAGKGRVRLGLDGTIYDLPPLDMREGRVNVSVWQLKPEPTDAFWVEFEFADGTFAESSVKYPFATDKIARSMNVIETAVTLEHTSGASGTPDTEVFLTAEGDRPVRETKVVETRVSPFAIRSERFDFSGEPMRQPKLPHRRWPMGPMRLSCHFTRLAADGKDHPIFGRVGWNEAPELKLMADGRLEASYNGGTDRGPRKFSVVVRSQKPLDVGRKTLIELVNDGCKFGLLVDGERQGEAELKPVRVFGNLSPYVGKGINGPTPTVGILHDLGFKGCPSE